VLIIKKSSFKQKVSNKFIFRNKNLKSVTSVKKSKNKSIEIMKLSSPIFTKPFKKVLKKSKFFKDKKGLEKEKLKNKPLYI